MFESENPPNRPNNIAIWFTGKNKKYRYYIHINEQGKLTPVRQELPVGPDDWVKHMQFAYSYDTPDGSVLASSTINEQEASPSPGGEWEPRLRKQGLSGPNLASAMNTHTTAECGEVHSIPKQSGEQRNGITASENGMQPKQKTHESGPHSAVGEDSKDQHNGCGNCTTQEEGCAGKQVEVSN